MNDEPFGTIDGYQITIHDKPAAPADTRTDEQRDLDAFRLNRALHVDSATALDTDVRAASAILERDFARRAKLGTFQTDLLLGKGAEKDTRAVLRKMQDFYRSGDPRNLWTDERREAEDAAAKGVDALYALASKKAHTAWWRNIGDPLDRAADEAMRRAGRDRPIDADKFEALMGSGDPELDEETAQSLRGAQSILTRRRDLQKAADDAAARRAGSDDYIAAGQALSDFEREHADELAAASALVGKWHGKADKALTAAQYLAGLRAAQPDLMAAAVLSSGVLKSPVSAAILQNARDSRPGRGGVAESLDLSFSASDKAEWLSLPKEDREIITPILQAYVNPRALGRVPVFGAVYEGFLEAGKAATNIGFQSAHTAESLLRRTVMDGADVQKWEEDWAELQEMRETATKKSENHWLPTDWAIGAMSQAPYMFGASLPRAGIALITAQAATDYISQVAREGGDVSSMDTVAEALGIGLATGISEKIEVDIFKGGRKMTPLERIRVYDCLKRSSIVGRILGDTAGELTQEALQDALMGAAVAAKLDRDWVPAMAQGAWEAIREGYGDFLVLGMSGVGTQIVAQRHGAINGAQAERISEFIAPVIKDILTAKAAGQLAPLPDMEAWKANMGDISDKFRKAGGMRGGGVKFLEDLGFKHDAALSIGYAIESTYRAVLRTGSGKTISDFFGGRGMRTWKDIFADFFGGAEVTPDGETAYTVRRTITNGRRSVETETRVELGKVETDCSIIEQRDETGAPTSQAQSLAASVVQGVKAQDPSSAMTEDDVLAMTGDELRQFLDAKALANPGTFRLTSGGAAVDSEQLAALTGTIRFDPTLDPEAFLHEAGHAFLAYAEKSGILSDADFDALRSMFGDARTSDERINEEAFSDALRDAMAGRVRWTDQTLFERIRDAIVRLLDMGAELLHLRRAKKSAADAARDSVFEQVLSGNVRGIPMVAASQSEKASPSGAATATPSETPPSAPPAPAPAPEPNPSENPTGSENPDSSETPARPRRAPTEWTAVTPDGSMKLSGDWVVVDASTLLASSDPGYDQALQPRDRSTMASDSQVHDIATALDPARLADSPTTDTGAPLVSADGMVLSGNGRTLAIRAAYASGLAGAYAEAVRARAAEMGLAVPDSMRAPVLARRLSAETSHEDLVRAAELSNRPQILSRNESETAEADAATLLSGGFLDLLQPGDNGELLGEANRAFMDAFINATGDQGLRTADGFPTEAAQKRVRRAVLAALFQDLPNRRDLIRAAVEDADELHVTRELAGLMRGAPAILRSATARPAYDLRGEIGIALADYLDFKRQGGGDINAYLAQGQLFDERPPEVAAVLREIGRRRDAASISDFLQDYARRAEAQAAEGQDTFAFFAPPTKLDLLAAASADTARTEAEQGTLRLSVSGVTPAEDAAYMDAVKRGDMETAQRMVDKFIGQEVSAVVDAYRNYGENIPDGWWFHGRGNRKESPRELAYVTELTRGYNWVAPDDPDASDWAIKPLPGAKIIDLSEDYSSGSEWLAAEIWNNGSVSDVFDSWRDDWESVDDVQGFVEEGFRPNDIGDSAGAFDDYHITDWLLAHGVDFVITPDGAVLINKEAAEIVDLKKGKADPVTYDVIGNVIPLSQRFDTANEDIRYSFTSNPVANIEAAKTEAQRVLDLVGGTELGNAVNRDFKGERQTTIIGRTIRTAGDLAAAAQIYRNPCFETFRYFYTKGGKVVWQTAVTARMPGFTPAAVYADGNINRTFAEINRMARALEPDGLWILHNHPSGNVTPSGADMQTTRLLVEMSRGMGIEFKGHVILDHNKYAFMSPTMAYGESETHELDFSHRKASFRGEPTANPSVPNQLLGSSANKPETVQEVAIEAAMAQNAATKPGEALTIVATNPRGGVRAIATVPTARLIGADGQTLRDYQAATGGFRLFLVGDINAREYPDNTRKALDALVASGAITDFIYPDEEASNLAGSTFLEMNRAGKKPLPSWAGVIGERVAEQSGPRFSIAARSFDWSALPNLHADVIASTSVGALQGSRFKDERKRVMPRYDEAKHLRETGDAEKADAILSELEKEARALAADKRTEWLGKYLLGKYHADTGAAKQVVEHYLKPETVAELKAALDPSRPVVALFPLTNVEGTSLNRLPFAYADELAARLGARVDTGLLKKDIQTLTRKGQNERASAEFEFDTAEIDFTDNPQIVIVDDTWTSGQTTVSGMDAILRANPNADVRAITTLASGRNGKHVKPTEKQLTSVLEKSSLPSVDALNDFLGYDIRRATGSELHGYVLNGRSGPDGIRERFGAPGVGRQNESGSGLDHGGVAGTAEETERGAGVAPDSVASRYSFTPIGAGLANESIFAGLLAADYVSGKDRGDETYERLRRALHVEDAGTLAEARAYAREMAEVRRYGLAGRAEASVRDDAAQGGQGADAIFGDAPSPDWTAEDYARHYEQNAAARALADAALGGMQEGVHLGDAARKAIDQARRNLIREAQGIDYEETVRHGGIDIAATLLGIDPDKFGALRKRKEDGKEEEEDADAEPERPGPGEPGGRPLTEEEAGQVETEQQSLDERAKKLLDLFRGWKAERESERRKKERRRAEEERRRAQRAATDPDVDKKQAKADDEDIDEEDTPDFTLFSVPLRLLKLCNIDVNNATEMAAFLRILVADYLVSRDATLTHETVFERRPDNVSIYRKTMMRMMDELATKLVDPTKGALLRNIQKHIERIPEVAGVDTIERRTSAILRSIQMGAVRRTQGDLIRELQRDIHALGIRGRTLDKMERDAERKINGEREAMARYVNRIVAMGPRAVATETDRLREIMDKRMADYSGADGRESAFGDVVRDAPVAPPGVKVESDVVYHDAVEKLGLLEEYGALRFALPAEIVEKGNKLRLWLEKSREEHLAKFEAKVAENRADRDAICAALASSGRSRRQRKGLFARFLEENGSVCFAQRVQILLADMPEGSAKAAASRALTRCMRLIAEGSQERSVLMRRYAREFEGAVAAAIKGRSDADGNEWTVKSYLAHLDEKIPDSLSRYLTKQRHYDDGTRGGDARLTWGQALNLLGYLEQTATYAENIKRHGREGQAAAIRAAASEADLALLSQLRAVYAGRRDALSVPVREIRGFSVYNPDPLYMPANMFIPGSERDGLDTRVRGAWNPLAAPLTPRRANSRDVDESVSIADAYNRSSKATADAIAFGVRGIDLRSILASGPVKEAIREAEGPDFARAFNAHLTDILTGGDPGESGGTSMEMLRHVGTMASYSFLAWNPASMLKQMTSVPAWAPLLPGGFRDVLRYMRDFDVDSLRELCAAPGFVQRYGLDGLGANRARAILADPTLNWVQKVAQCGMIGLQIGDSIPGFLVGTGLYKAKKQEYANAGESPELAAEHAARDTWALIEECQQSDLVQNLPELMRRHGVLGRSVLKFAASPLQQLSWEIHAWRIWKRTGNRDDLRRAIDTTVANRVIMPALLWVVENAMGAALGDDPDDEDSWRLRELLVMSLLGSFGRVFFVGSLTDSGLRRLFGLRTYTNGAMPGTDMAAGLVRHGVGAARFLIEADYDRAVEELVKTVGSVAPPVKMAAKAVENWTD